MSKRVIDSVRSSSFMLHLIRGKNCKQVFVRHVNFLDAFSESELKDHGSLLLSERRCRMP